jgi:hypothetical protein
MLVMLVNSMTAVVVRPARVVICPVIWITPAPVIAVVAAGVIPIIPRISVVAVTICGITEPDSDASDPN